MAGFDLITKSGHNMYDISSLLQKAIRRSDVELASYAAYELYGRYYQYVWKRLLFISAEDCYGIITKEIVGMYYADTIANKGRKDYDKDPIFLAKAVTLLCLARKNRDACYVACNFMHASQSVNLEDIPHLDEIQQLQVRTEDIPEWVFDCHTRKGKANGKTDLDMTIAEQNALKPLQKSLFDEANWANYYEMQRKAGKCSDREYQAFLKFSDGKEVNPAKGIIIDED